MSDYIKREDAIRAIMEYIRDSCDGSDEFIDGLYGADIIIKEDVPSADVAEIVRCEDCKYWLPHTQYGYDAHNGTYCNYCNAHMPDDDFEAETWDADDFCSYGERKDEHE